MSNSDFNKYYQKLEASKNKIVSSKSESAKFVESVRVSMNISTKDSKKSK